MQKSRPPSGKVLKTEREGPHCIPVQYIIHPETTRPSSSDHCRKALSLYETEPSTARPLLDKQWIDRISIALQREIGLFDPMDFNISEIIDGRNELIGKELQAHGFAILHLDNLSDLEQELMLSWEHIFSKTFELSDYIKAGMPKFDSYQGHTMGYRRDGKREFLETRLCGNHSIEPAPPTEGHEEFVRSLWKLLRKLCLSVLSCMAYTLGVDDTYFIDLVDGEELLENELSSTVMRICSYPYDDDLRDPDPTPSGRNTSLAFGAHTDVSFVTLGLLSSVSGLDIQDLRSGDWKPVEEHATIRQRPDGIPCSRAVVFVGDMMQLMTRGYYKAAVHRVTAYDINTHTENTPFVQGSDKAYSRRQLLQNRISCPFIMRGRHRTEVKPLSAYRRYPCRSLPTEYMPCAPAPVVPTGDTVIIPALPEVTEPHCGTEGASPATATTCQHPQPPSPMSPGFIVELPDLEETSMKVIHKLLDLKRRKCTRENSGNADADDEPNRDWVLSAFPVTVYDIK